MKSNSSRRKLLLGLLGGLLLAGCGPGTAQVTERQRREAAQLAAEARFAVSVREWARAEKLFAQAAQIDPDVAYLTSLGTMRVRLGQRAGAKEAYQAAIRACELEARRSPDDPEPWLKHAYLLALLGQASEGRTLLQKAEKRFPKNSRLRSFVDGKQYDAMLASPAFKEAAL